MFVLESVALALAASRRFCLERKQRMAYRDLPRDRMDLDARN